MCFVILFHLLSVLMYLFREKKGPKCKFMFQYWRPIFEFQFTRFGFDIHRTNPTEIDWGIFVRFMLFPKLVFGSVRFWSSRFVLARSSAVLSIIKILIQNHHHTHMLMGLNMCVPIVWPKSGASSGVGYRILPRRESAWHHPVPGVLYMLLC